MTWIFTNPNSSKGIRIRAAKLPNCAYRVFLELAATQLENKTITTQEAAKAIEYMRTNQKDLVSVAVKMLKPTPEQVSEVLNLFKTGTIKEVE